MNRYFADAHGTEMSDARGENPHFDEGPISDKCLSCEKPLEHGENDDYCDYCDFCRPLTPQEIAMSEKIAKADPDELPF